MRISRRLSALALHALVTALLAAPLATPLGAQPHRRALLIGIDDYTASHLDPPLRATPAPGRDFPSLGGAVHDVQAMRAMLLLLYGFDPRDIVTLTDQQATRAAILDAIESRLVQPAAKGDVTLFYYSGHGSQVRNSLSDETDHLDESIVPADSRLGALDIRDKELRRWFNRILDRGARLTVMLDSCHSGSGARGLETGTIPRGLSLDRRDVADRPMAGPRPEDRGALVISAAEDRDVAWETHDDEGHLHGAFSWAWIRAMRDAAQGEPVSETFQRAQARLHGETPFQAPVLAGTAEARSRPFLGSRTDRRDDRTVVAIERVRDDGIVVLQAGWASGLTVGSQLRTLAGAARLVVTAVHGLGESEAHVETADRGAKSSLQAGALVEVVGWALPSSPPLRVWLPRIEATADDLSKLAATFAAAASRAGLQWIVDPVATTPAHTLRWHHGAWELLDGHGVRQRFDANGAAQAVAAMPHGSSLFVQFPAPASLASRVAAGLADGRTAIDVTEHPTEADYILTGHFSAGKALEYAWVRPIVKQSDRRRTSLPSVTGWHPARDEAETGATLRSQMETLRKIRSWSLLASPPGEASPYHLALLRLPDGEPLRDRLTIGGERYRLALRRAAAMPTLPIRPRYIYIFTIDSSGKSALLFPRDAGSVENRLPLAPPSGTTGWIPPVEIALDDTAQFRVTEPYGIDTYLLLTTDQRLPNPGVLEWEGVKRIPETPLEQLLALTMSGARAGAPITTAHWSIERVICESTPTEVRAAHRATGSPR
jgi:uncharacterized caspase-like protein